MGFVRCGARRRCGRLWRLDRTREQVGRCGRQQRRKEYRAMRRDLIEHSGHSKWNAIRVKASYDSAIPNAVPNQFLWLLCIQQHLQQTGRCCWHSVKEGTACGTQSSAYRSQVTRVRLVGEDSGQQFASLGICVRYQWRYFTHYAVMAVRCVTGLVVVNAWLVVSFQCSDGFAERGCRQSDRTVKPFQFTRVSVFGFSRTSLVLDRYIKMQWVGYSGVSVP